MKDKLCEVGYIQFVKVFSCRLPSVPLENRMN